MYWRDTKNDVNRQKGCNVGFGSPPLIYILIVVQKISSNLIFRVGLQFGTGTCTVNKIFSVNEISITNR